MNWERQSCIGFRIMLAGGFLIVLAVVAALASNFHAPPLLLAPGMVLFLAGVVISLHAVR